MKEIKIDTDYITLGQLLKLLNLVSSGGEVKYYLSNNKIFINDILENRRGKKLYPEDMVKIKNLIYIIKND